MSLFNQIGMYWRFAWELRKFLGEPITLEQSRQTIKQRLGDRDKNLLTIVKRTIYENKKSPYLKLLNFAGCEYGDFEKMVRSDGIEPALRKLSEQGVYISIEEFKGKKEIVRGSEALRFKENDFDNPFISGHLEVSSGSTRSTGTRTVYDFDFLTASWSTYMVHMLDAFDVFSVPYAIWYPIMPGAGPVVMLSYTKAGKTPSRWFSPVEKQGFNPSFKNRMGTNYIVYIGRLLGAKWPAPEYLTLDDAWQVAQWLAGTIREQGGVCLNTYVSAAVRICKAAKEKGLDIKGTKFLLAGEPITRAKRQEIESVGAHICPIYGFMEAGFVGTGCFNPASADDTHFFKDSFALIQHPREVPHAGVSVDAFLFTTLLPSNPKILLNVESGDYGQIKSRSCGCRLEELGLTDHIYNIRGFDRLTSEGMTFFGTDLLRIIEEVLPARFGGGSTNYQMVEEEDEKGHTRLSVIVSPEVGAINEDELIQTVLAEISRGKDTQRMMAEIWAQAKTLKVKRMQPFTTARGKLLPLHILKRK